MEAWKSTYASKIVSPEQAISRLKNGDRVYLGSLCSEPGAVIDALASSYLEDLEIIQFISGCKASALATDGPGRFNVKSFFVGGLACKIEEPIEANYVPLFHSQIPGFFRNRRIPIDVAIVQVSEPDRFGRFSLGISVDVTLAAVESARMVIAQVNPRMPRTHGDTLIVGDRIDYMVPVEEDLFEIPPEVLGERERTISRYCGELIADGSILQFGFAGISHGLMDHLKDRRNLGIHTEIYTDGLMDLTQSGAVTNATKKMFRGKSLATCCMGTKKLYDFVHDNALVEMYPSDVLLEPGFIGSNDRVVAINLAIEVDLRGQIRQGSPTWTAFEGSGGDHDFMRGANLPKGGRSIICLRSTSLRREKSTIVPTFGPKAAVFMNRGEVNYIITEYGIAYLGGKSIRERAMGLIEIAHPDHRETLMKAAREMGYVYKNQYYVRTCPPDLRARIRKQHTFEGGLVGHVRAIKLTDESMMRDLFYHLSESSVYFRYFSPRRSMPHENLQKYVNLSEENGLSLVITIGPRENRRIIAEARYVAEQGNEFPEVAFMVDEKYHGKGIATFLLEYLMQIAKERGVQGFQADVLVSNTPMLRVFEKLPFVVQKKIEDGVLTFRWRFDQLKESKTA